ncbi:MAG: CHAT domain-containing protein [Chloroflexi bacterium]|nr:CHAT domain-containing protein [Chloroflexota bacterium]
MHFDGHGVYDQSLGLGFLLFENEKQESDQVDANRLGNLLNQSGTPLMVLNACQSGMQKGEQSLCQRWRRGSFAPGGGQCTGHELFRAGGGGA